MIIVQISRLLHIPLSIKLLYCPIPQLIKDVLTMSRLSKPKMSFYIYNLSLLRCNLDRLEKDICQKTTKVFNMLLCRRLVFPSYAWQMPLIQTASSPFLDSREVARNSRARKNWSSLFSFISPLFILAHPLNYPERDCLQSISCLA